MLPANRIPAISPRRDHIVTAKEALEGLYIMLSLEADVRLVAAALRAGWSADEALHAIDQLRADECKH